MYRNEKPVSINRQLLLFLVLVNAISLEEGMVHNSRWYWLLWITVPLLLCCAIVIRRNSMEAKRNKWFTITREQLQ